MPPGSGTLSRWSVGGHIAVVEGVAETGTAGVVCEAAGVRATGVDAVVVEIVASGIVHQAAVANAVSCTIRKRTAVADAAGAVAVVAHRSAFNVVVVPFATWTARAAAVADTTADAAGVGATGVTVCTVTADANLASVIDVVSIVAVAWLMRLAAWSSRGKWRVVVCEAEGAAMGVVE
jgi:hypothetical protein